MADPAALYGKLTQAFDRRDWPSALGLVAQIMPLAPKHAGVYYIAGISHLELQQMPQALECLRRAQMLEPSRVDFAVQYARALNFIHKYREAKLVADRALASAPTDATTLDTLGVVYTQIGDYTAAVDVFRQAMVLAPTNALYRYNLATSLVAAGDIDAAEAQIEACLALEPRYWRAHLTLAQLRRQTPSTHHVERLTSLLPEISGDDTQGQVCINMALAKEHEDLSNHAQAFDYFVHAKSAGKIQRSSVGEKDQDLFEAIEQSFREISPTTDGDRTEEPIFVIGMPRTGTTLVERIISSHPEVHSAGELLNFGMSLKFLSGCDTPRLIDRETIIGARNVDWRRLGATYLASTRPSTSGKLHFVDKLPHNFLYAGFIARALPNAKIICLRRDPLDTCLSNFRQLFAPKSPYFDYTYDLLDTGRYYVLFDHLMGHWRKTFPGRILEISYESLVESQEASSRQLIEFCGLSWDDSCMRFEDNPAPVATASAVQVRTPIYRGALRRWKKYEPQLTDLIKLLTQAGIELDL